MSGPAFLNVKFYSTQLHQLITVREFLQSVLLRYWREGEVIGDDYWETELIIAAIGAKYVKGTVDSEGCLEEYDEEVFDKLMVHAITSLK